MFPLCSSVTGTSNPSTEVREAPKWFIRPAEAQEAKPVAEVMARAFHRPARLKYLDGAAFKIFQAEVMDSMIAKLHLSDSSCFACLVAQTEDESLCGAVEVSQQDHPQVLQVMLFVCRNKIQWDTVNHDCLELLMRRDPVYDWKTQLKS